MAQHPHPQAAEQGHGYVHGQMDIAEHQKMFSAFIKFWVLVFGTSIGILIFLALFNS